MSYFFQIPVLTASNAFDVHFITPDKNLPSTAAKTQKTLKTDYEISGNAEIVIFADEILNRCDETIYQ